MSGKIYSKIFHSKESFQNEAKKEHSKYLFTISVY